MAIVRSNINGILIFSGTSTERAALAATAAGKGTEFWESDTKIRYQSDGTNWSPFKISGAGLVTLVDQLGVEITSLGGVTGLARNRFISATTGTLPTLAGSGCAVWLPPGARGIVINSVRVVSGTLPTAANADLTVRYAVDAANDAAAAILVPVTPNASSATADIGQVDSFCLDIRQLTGVVMRMDPVYIDVSAGITRLDLIHNIGTTLVLQFGIRAVEKV